MVGYCLLVFEAHLNGFVEVKKLLEQMCQSPIPELQANALALTGYLAAQQTLEQSVPMFAAAEQFVSAGGKAMSQRS